MYKFPKTVLRNGIVNEKAKDLSSTFPQRSFLLAIFVM